VDLNLCDSLNIRQRRRVWNHLLAFAVPEDVLGGLCSVKLKIFIVFSLIRPHLTEIHIISLPIFITVNE